MFQTTNQILRQSRICTRPECCTALLRLFIWRSMFALRAQGCNKMETQSSSNKTMPEYCLDEGCIRELLVRGWWTLYSLCPNKQTTSSEPKIKLNKHVLSSLFHIFAVQPWNLSEILRHRSQYQKPLFHPKHAKNMLQAGSTGRLRLG